MNKIRTTSQKGSNVDLGEAISSSIALPFALTVQPDHALFTEYITLELDPNCIPYHEYMQGLGVSVPIDQSHPLSYLTAVQNPSVFMSELQNTVNGVNRDDMASFDNHMYGNFAADSFSQNAFGIDGFSQNNFSYDGFVGNEISNFNGSGCDGDVFGRGAVIGRGWGQGSFDLNNIADNVSLALTKTFVVILYKDNTDML